MSFFNEKELEEILGSGEFDRLIGKYENEWFDCKKAPYDLESEKGKHELAKDISSFANVDGGYILIGAKGEDDLSHSGEQIKEISTFEQTLVNIEQNKKIIADRIHPNVEGLTMVWYSSKDNPAKGLILIKIPPQKESVKPFLNNKIFDEEGNKISGTIFGLFQRRGDNSTHFELRDLYRLIQLGQHYEKNLEGRLDALELRFKEFSDTSRKEDSDKKKETLEKKINERIIATLTKTNQLEEPTLVLAAYIEENYRIKNFNFSGEISNLLQRTTQPLRDGGWKLLYSSSLMTNSLSLIEAGYNSKSLSLYDDGSAIYLSDIDQIALINSPSQILPIALIEVVYQFADFYKRFIDFIEDDFKNVIIRVELINLKKDNFQTSLSRDLRPMRVYTHYPAPEDSMKHDIETDRDFRPEVLAFQIVKTIYHWFGIHQFPPYSKEENDVGMIDFSEVV
jgi:hypothetical protein